MMLSHFAVSLLHLLMLVHGTLVSQHLIWSERNLLCLLLSPPFQCTVAYSWSDCSVCEIILGLLIDWHLTTNFDFLYLDISTRMIE